MPKPNTCQLCDEPSRSKVGTLCEPCYRWYLRIDRLSARDLAAYLDGLQLRVKRDAARFGFLNARRRKAA